MRQAQPIPSELTAKLLGNRVAVSPIVTVEPRRRKFHKPITLTLPLPQASSKGMINHYTGDAPTLRLLCSITGGTSRAQWEDVTGSTPLTFINDCVSFTTTVSARFWLMDCRNVADASKMATELYREAIHVPFMAKFVVFAKRTDTNEARIRLFCMTDDREDKTLEHKEHFTEVSNSRDVEVLEGKPVYVEFAGNLVPVTKSGEQLRLVVRAFKENRLPFTMRVKDPSAEPRSWTIIMKEPKVSKNEPAQTPVCVLQFGLPENIVHDTDVNVDEHYNYTYTHDSNTETHKRAELRITDISNFVSDDWINLAHELGFQSTDIAQIQREYPDSSGQQCMSMLNLWMNEISGQDSVIALERALNNIGRVDVVEKCNFAEIGHYPSQNGVYVESEKHQSSQSPNNKYAAEEKAVIEDEIVKTVTERRMEIEQRLNGEPVTIEKKYEPYTRGDDVVQMTSKPTEMPAVEPIEPTEVSFEHKRMSFERGVSIEQVLQEDIPVKDKLVVLEEKKMMSIDEKPIDVDMDVDATSLTFHEKRLSFEQGIPVKEIIQKKVEDTTTVSGHGKESTTVIETEKSVVKSDTTLAEDAKLSDTKAVPKPSIELTKDTDEQIRRDSILFEEVSQGLVKLDSNESKVEDKSELLSPQSSKTPPPSPAEFKEIEQQNESKQRQTESISAEKEPQTALWSQDNDDLLDTHGFGEHLNGIETPNLSKPKIHKSLADIDEEFEERSVVLHPFFDQPKKDIHEQVQFVKHHDDSPAFESPLTDKSVSHHDTGISLTREYSDTLTSSGIKTKPKHTDTAFDEEAELTDNGLSPIQPDEVGLTANEIIEIKKKIGMYDAGNSPIIFMESIALSPFETVTSDVSTITDDVKKIDVANSPIESNKIQRNIDTTVDVKKMIMKLEKSGAGVEDATFQQSPKRKPPVKTLLSGSVLPEEHQTLYIDIEKKHKKNDTNTMNIQSKLDEVIKTEKCVLEHLEKVVNPSENNSELERKLLQIVNIETSMLHKFEKIIDKTDESVNNSCLKNLEKNIIPIEKTDEKLKKVDTMLDALQQSPKKCSEDKIEKKYIDTGYKKEESIMEPIKVTGISKELKQLIDDDEEEQERMYRVLMNENNTDKNIYSNKTPVIEEIITPKRVKSTTKKDNTIDDSQNIEFNKINTNSKDSILSTKEKINFNKNLNLKENEQLNTETYKTEINERLTKDTKDQKNKIFYEEDDEEESDIFEKFTREHLKKSIDLSHMDIEKDDKDRKHDTKDKDFDIVDEENEINNTKKDKSILFIPKTIEKGLKDITMTLTSIVKKMDVNDMSGKKNESEGGDKETKVIIESTKQEGGEIESNKHKNTKKTNTKKDLKSNITPQTPILKRDILAIGKIKSDNLKNDSIESCKYNIEKDIKKELVDKETDNNEQLKINKDIIENNQLVTSANNTVKEINKNILKTDDSNINKNYKTKNNETDIDIDKTLTDKNKELKTDKKKIIKKLPLNSKEKQILNQNEVEQNYDLNINNSKTQIFEQKHSENLNDKLDIGTNIKIENKTKSTSSCSYEKYETTETNAKTFIHKTEIEHTETKTTNNNHKTHHKEKLIKVQPTDFENIKINEGGGIITQENEKLKIPEEKSILQQNEREDEQSKTESNKSKLYMEGIESDKIHFDEFYKWVDKLVEEKNENVTNKENEGIKKRIFKTLRTASIDKEHIEDESNTVKEFISKQIITKYSNEEQKDILTTTKPKTKQTITETATILKTKSKVITENKKAGNLTKNVETIKDGSKTEQNKTDSESQNLDNIKTESQKKINIESKTTEIIKHEIITDKPKTDKIELTKTDSKETIKLTPIEKEIPESLKTDSILDKLTIEKSDTVKDDTKTESQKKINIESKTTEIIKHEIITDKPKTEKIELTKSDSKDSIKSIASAKDVLLTDDKDRKYPTTDKVELTKSDSKETIKLTPVEKDIPESLKTDSVLDKITIEKSDTVKDDIKTESQKIINIESKTTEIIKHEIITDLPKTDKIELTNDDKDRKYPTTDKVELTKSDSNETIKLTPVEKDIPESLKTDSVLDKITIEKSDTVKDDIKTESQKIINIESKTTEIIKHEIITDLPKTDKIELTKSDSKDSIKSIASEKDVKVLLTDDKEQKDPTTDKIKLSKSDSKDSITSYSSELDLKGLLTDDKDRKYPTTDKVELTKSDSKETIKLTPVEKDIPESLKTDSVLDKITIEKSDTVKDDIKTESQKIINIESKTTEIIKHEIITDLPKTDKIELIKSDSKDSIKSIASELDLKGLLTDDKDHKIPKTDKIELTKSDSKDSIKSIASEKDVKVLLTDDKDRKYPTTDKVELTKSDSKETIKLTPVEKDIPESLKTDSVLDKITIKKSDTIIDDIKTESQKIINIESKTTEIIKHEIITDVPKTDKIELTKSDSLDTNKSDKDQKDPTTDKIKLSKSVSKDSITFEKDGKDIPESLKTDSVLDKITIEKSDTVKDDIKTESQKIINIESKTTEIIKHEIITDLPKTDKIELTKSDSKDSIKSIASEKDVKVLTTDKVELTKSDSKETIKLTPVEKDIPESLKTDSVLDKITIEKSDTVKDDIKTESQKIINIESKTTEIIKHEIITDLPKTDKIELIKSDSKDSIKSIASELDLKGLLTDDKDHKIPKTDKIELTKSDSKDSIKSIASEKDVKVLLTDDKDRKYPTTDKVELTKSDSKETIKLTPVEKDIPESLKTDSVLDKITIKKSDTIIDDIKTESQKIINIESKTTEIIKHEIITDVPKTDKIELTKSEKVLLTDDKDRKYPTTDKVELTKSDSKETIKLTPVEKDIPESLKTDSVLDKITIEKSDTVKDDIKTESQKIINIESKTTEIIKHEIITDLPKTDKIELIKSDSKDSIKSIASELDLKGLLTDDKDHKLTKSDSKDSIKSIASEKDVKVILTDDKDQKDPTTDKIKLNQKDPTTDKIKLSKSASKDSITSYSSELDLKGLLTDDKDQKYPTTDKVELTKSDSKETIKLKPVEKDIPENQKDTTTDKIKLSKSDSKDSITSYSSELDLKGFLTDDKDHTIPKTDKIELTKSVSKDSIKSIASEKDVKVLLSDDKDQKDSTTDKIKLTKSDSKETTKLTPVEKDIPESLKTDSALDKITIEKSDNKIELPKSHSKDSIKSKASEKDGKVLLTDDKDQKDPTTDKIKLNQKDPTTDKIKLSKSDSKDSITSYSSELDLKGLLTDDKDHTIPKTDKIELTKSDSKDSIKSIASEKDVKVLLTVDKDQKDPTTDKVELTKSDSKETIKLTPVEKDIPESLKTDSVLDKITIEKSDTVLLTDDKDQKDPTTDKIKLRKSDSKDSITSYSSELDLKVLLTDDKDHTIPKTDKIELTKSDSKDSIKSIASEKDVKVLLTDDKDQKDSSTDKINLTKSDSKETTKLTPVEKDIPETSEKDVKVLLTDDKDQKDPTTDKIKLRKSDSKDSITSYSSELDLKN
ncbi:uncharacterized protein LOC113558317 [Rhopalosiphum maidis]|uniref:uncharacterized protein LOC113558317 n=1 Tax=Rhopalosiphum maidis TaxID=43146 RepID=UPI000F007C45|nr:uncharacterized protein LOC113558317 [Rhopalosiphum maidis]